MENRRDGVHRGKVGVTQTMVKVEQILKELGVETKISLTGSQASGPKGANKSTDVDIKATLPEGYSKEQLDEIESIVTKQTGADFYFDSDEN